MELLQTVWVILGFLALKALLFFVGHTIHTLNCARHNQSLLAKCSNIVYAVLRPGARQSSAKRVLVVGGSSYLGQHIVDELAALGADKVTVVSFDAAPQPAHADVTYVRGDVRNRSHVHMALSGCSCVVLMLPVPWCGGGGWSPGWGPSRPGEDVLDSAVYKAAKQLVEVCLELNVGSLVLTSTSECMHA